MKRLVLFLITATACRSAFAAGQPRIERESVRIERLGRTAPFATYSGFADSTRVVVRDTVTWRQIWQTLHRPFFPQPPVPAVDFGKYMVVVAALGARPTAGYDLLIEEAAQDSAGIEVAIRTSAPGAGCTVSAVRTQPVDVVKLPASDRRVRFRERNVVAACGVP